jgi:glycosyltransferase involved in cell wall biosynthesis
MMPARVLYLHGVGEIGGAERDLLVLLKRVDRTKWEPCLACPEGSALAVEALAMGVPVFPILLPPWRKLLAVPRRPLAILKVARLIRRLRPALVHVNDVYWVPFVSWAIKWWDIPCVATVRQYLDTRRAGLYHLDRLDRVFAVSNAVAQVLVDSGFDQKKLMVLYSGIDPLNFSPGAGGGVPRSLNLIPPGAPIIGCVANLQPVKGQDILLLACAKVLKKVPSAHCLFVGLADTKFGNEMRDLAGRLGIADRVHVVGFQQDVRPFLAMMDIVVLVSRSEALGLALLEAMALEKPVVATRVGGIPEVVEDGVTGRLVPSDDPESLAESLLELLADRELRVRMGRAGRQRVLERFRIEQTIDALQRTYEELVGCVR